MKKLFVLLASAIMMIACSSNSVIYSGTSCNIPDVDKELIDEYGTSSAKFENISGVYKLTLSSIDDERGEVSEYLTSTSKEDILNDLIRLQILINQVEKQPNYYDIIEDCNLQTFVSSPADLMFYHYTPGYSDMVDSLTRKYSNKPGYEAAWYYSGFGQEKTDNVDVERNEPDFEMKKQEIINCFESSLNKRISGIMLGTVFITKEEISAIINVLSN